MTQMFSKNMPMICMIHTTKCLFKFVSLKIATRQSLAETAFKTKTCLLRLQSCLSTLKIIIGSFFSSLTHVWFCCIKSFENHCCLSVRSDHGSDSSSVTNQPPRNHGPQSKWEILHRWWIEVCYQVVIALNHGRGTPRLANMMFKVLIWVSRCYGESQPLQDKLIWFTYTTPKQGQR